MASTYFSLLNLKENNSDFRDDDKASKWVAIILAIVLVLIAGGCGYAIFAGPR